MKTKLLIFLVLCLQLGYSQKIEDAKFDKFDSTYNISTKDEPLVGKILRKHFLSVRIHYNWLQKTEFAYNPNAKYFYVILGFKTDIITSTDNKSEIKIQFVDGTFGTYNLPNAKYQIVTEIGLVGFDVHLGDKLFTTDIKAIRISTTDTRLDYEIPAKKASFIKNALALLKAESEKL